MGDRGNVKLIFGKEESPIYFYTHWQGTNLPEIVRHALIRGRSRWNDPSYLARIIFSEMIRNEVDELTGYGIAPFQTDSNHDDVEVCLDAMTVALRHEPAQSFSDYVKRQDLAGMGG